MTNSSSKHGVLYIIATPIGNREDMSLRAIKTLQSVDAILAEDTRHSRPLLTHFGIKKKLIALHAHNEETKSHAIITALLEGHSYALISDAGTPLISDPGYPLVTLARAHQIPVVPIPGACAFIAALSAAGVACDAFTFVGFLPAKMAARREKLASLKVIDHTLVCYESTHRIIESIDDIAFTFGEDAALILAKELTKTFEQFVHGSCSVVKAWLLENAGHCKGEFVLIIPPRPIQSDDTHNTKTMLTVLLAELPLKQAVGIASQLTDVPKNTLYALALSMRVTTLPH